MDLKVCPCKFKLNYLELLGELNTNTPLCVIQEILDAHGFEHYQLNIKHHTKYVTAINSSLEATPIINIPVKDDDTITFRNLARFINSYTKWDKASLITALSSLLTWYDKNKLLPTKDFTVGMITPQQVNNLNSVILYVICCRNKITTSKEDTIDQLSEKVKLLFYNRQALLQYAYSKITMMGTADIIALTVNCGSIDGNIAQTTSLAGRLELISNKLHLDNKDITTASLTSDYEQLHNIKALQKMIIPTTPSQAVALSAILHQSDISSSSNPQLQYLSKGSSLLTYNDQHLSKIAAINPALLSLKRGFNPLFPVSYYSSQELTAILRRETHIIPSQLVDKYQALYLTYICENFYHGLQPEVTNKTSLIELLDIDEVKSNEIVCYGTRNQSMTFYKVSELTNLFVANNNFINPVRSDNKRSSSISLFTSNAIGKLKILATQLSGGVITGVEWKNLLQAIDKVDEANKDISHAALKFKEYYHQSCSTNGDKKCDIVKQEIKDTLLSLFKVSMFMRGWDGTKSGLPIEISLVRDSEQSTVDLRVTQELALLYKLLNNNGKIVGDLPLVRYLDSHFIQSNSKDDGISIKDRLDIVKKGTTNASCIRLSSNWLAASAYHYSIILGLNRPFNIIKLRVIS